MPHPTLEPATARMASHAVTHRRLRRVGLVVAATVAAIAAGASGLLVARLGGARGYPVDQLREGVNPANLQITPMFVVRRGSTVIALRAFEPDGTTPVAWCPGQNLFEDPGTGSKFAENGAYLAGPAPRGLDRFGSKIVDGVLQVAPGTQIPGPPRGPEAPADSLPPCDWQHALFAPGVAPPPSPVPF